MVKNHNSGREDSTHDVLVSTTPLDGVDANTVRLEGGLGFPLISRRRADAGGVLAAPHDDVTILGSTGDNAFARVVLNAVDLVLEELSTEGRLSEGEDVILISLDVEHSNHVLSGDSSHESSSRPDSVQEFWVTSNRQFNFAVGDELLGQIEFELDQKQV